MVKAVTLREASWSTSVDEKEITWSSFKPDTLFRLQALAKYITMFQYYSLATWVNILLEGKINSGFLGGIKCSKKKKKYKFKSINYFSQIRVWLTDFGPFVKSLEKVDFHIFICKESSFPDTTLCRHSYKERKNEDNQCLFMFVCSFLLHCIHLLCNRPGHTKKHPLKRDVCW